MGIFSKLFGDANKRFLDNLKPQIEAINNLEKEYKKLSDKELKNKSLKLKKIVQKDTKLDEILVEAFALVKEAASRTLNQRHFDAQLMGGIILHQGNVVEMKTGEGKTLTSTLPVYLNALKGKGVHVITVNDYLAKRDAMWMGQIYDFLGLTVGIIQHNACFIYDSEYINENKDKLRDQGVSIIMDYLKPVEKKEAYNADITYGTNNEFGFDYLRDNMVQDLEKQVQRELYYVIIDEVDSVLIDEARTPLIISAPAEQSTNQYQKFSQLVNKLIENEDYNIDEKMKACTLTEGGIKKIEKELNIDNIYEHDGITTIHYIESALKAKALFFKDKDYVVKDDEVIIIDEFTGRMMPGRRYSEGLHQAIEAKENVKVQRESMTLATITFQNFFRMYKKLSGMTGTAATEAEEMAKIYNLDVTILPTNKEFIRDDMKDRIYKNERGKFKAIIKEIKNKYKNGQPVLVGTISIEKNELLGKYLEKEGIPFNLLNAKFHEKEAEIISQAGRKKAITIATNMAGRGVDITLGGIPFNKEKYEEIKNLGGLHVLGTERHESRRIDNQLRGRAGRQGDPGSSQFYISMEDDLMRIFGSDRMKSLMDKLGLDEETAIENKMISNSIESAQKKVEGHNFDVRKHLVEYDDIINKHRQVIYESRQKFIKSKQSNNFVIEYINKEIEEIISFHTLSKKNIGDFDPKEIIETIKSIFILKKEEIDEINKLLKTIDKNNSYKERTDLIEYIQNIAKKNYINLTNDINSNINIPENIENPMNLIEKNIVLKSIDTLWVEHLTIMDKLRTGIGLQGYGQKDPLVEYKREAYNLFNNLINNIRKQIVYSIYKIGISQKMILQNNERKKEFKKNKDGFSPFEKEVENRKNNNKIISKKPTNKLGKKVGRNDLCICGSGKKYKKCCIK